MKRRMSYVSNSSSSSFLVPKDVFDDDIGMRCVKLPEEIWKAIERNHVEFDGTKLDLSSVSNEWWLTVLVSDCMDEWGRINSIPGAKPYLEGHDAPYGWYDEDGEKNYIVFTKYGEKFYVDAYDFIGHEGNEIPDAVRLREEVNRIMESKSLNKSQKLDAIKCLFNY